MTNYNYLIRTLTAWGLILALAVTQAAPAAWAAPAAQTTTLRTLESPENSNTVRTLESGLEEKDRPPTVLPKPAIKRLTVPKPQPSIAPTSPLSIISDQPSVQPPKPQAGLEEPPVFKRQGASWLVLKAGVIRGDSKKPTVDLQGGIVISAEGGDSRVELADGIVIEPQVILVAPQGQNISIGPNSQVLAQAQMWGQHTAGAKTQLSGIFTGRTMIGDGTVFSRGSNTVVHDSVLQPVTIRTERNSQVVETVVPVRITEAASIRNSLVIGSLVWQGAVLVNSIVSLANLGNHTMLSRSAVYGASTENRVAVAHHNDLISLYALPLSQWRDLRDAAARSTLWRELAALRFGVITQRTTAPVVPDDQHPVNPSETLAIRFEDGTVTTVAQGLNFGKGTTTSNFDPRHDGTKGSSIAWGGASFGVDVILSAPTEVGPRALAGSNAVVSGRKLTPGTLILPTAADPKMAVRPQYIDLTRGRLGDGVLEDVETRLQAIRLLQVFADVAAVGVRQARSDQERAGHRKELELLKSYIEEAIGDLHRHLALVGVSAQNLARDAATHSTDAIQRRLKEQQGVIAELSTYHDITQDAASAVAAALAAGLEEHAMANVQTFRRSATGIVALKDGTPALAQEWIDRGLDSVRGKGPKPFFILFGAGSFSRYVDSVTATSPYFAQVARDRGLANDEGGPSKLMAPLGVSGLGPLMRQLESLSELGARAGTPVDVAIVDSPGNRAMLLHAIQQDRDSSTPRIAWDYLHLVPGGTPVDQGEGLQVQYRDAAGQLHPLFEFNPATGQMDRPVMRPSGELGAFLAGITAAKAAGISIPERTWVPVYGDEAVLFSDPAFVAAVLGHADEADLTGGTITHRFENGQWVPSGGVWPEAVWPDGTTALVVAERNVRDPQATGVFNPALDRDEHAAAPACFPFNAAAPIFSGRFVEQELLNPDRMSRRLSSKRIAVRTGPGDSETETREVLLTELELTESAQIATQRASGEPLKWRAQIVETESGRYQAIKFLASVEPVNQALAGLGAGRLRALLPGRLDGDPRFVEVSPRFRGFQGDGRLRISGDVGIVLDHRGLWIHEKVTPPAGRDAPTLFSEEGRLLIPANAQGYIPLIGQVDITPEIYRWLQIQQRLQPLLSRPAVTVLVMDVDGVTTAQDGDLDVATRDSYAGFLDDVSDGRLLLLTDISPQQLWDRVVARLPATAQTRTVQLPLSGGEYVGHVIPEGAVNVVDRWVEDHGGKGTVLRMAVKQTEYAAGQISGESLAHGFDINRTGFSEGPIVGIDIELNKAWLDQVRQAQGQDPREAWVAALRPQLLSVGVPEPVVATLHSAGSGSITWTPAKGQALRQWAQVAGVDPAMTIFVDDSASNFKDFPEVAYWPGLLVYIGRHDPTLPSNVVQIAQPGEPKPANGPEIARWIVQVVRAQHRLESSASGLEEDTIEQVLGHFDGRMRAWHGQATPIVLLSDRTATFGINSGRYDDTETAKRLRAAQVSPAVLRQLLEALEAQLRLPPANRVVGARAAAIDLAVAAQRMDKLGLSPAEALRSARVRVQGTDGWRGLRTPNERMFTILGSGRLSPELVELYHFSFIEWGVAQGLMRPGDRYVLGYDPRDDAEIEGIPPGSYTKAAIRGAQRAGATVVDVGVVPIWAAPLYMVWSGAKACGVITASHNEKDFTGNKLFVGPALKLFPEDDYEVSGHFFRNLGAHAWRSEKNDLPAYQSVRAQEQAHEEAIALAERTAFQPENSWAQTERPLNDWLVVVDAARGAYAGYAADPERKRPADPAEFGIMSRVVAGLGATVWEVGKNLRRGNVNEKSGVGQFEGAGLLEVHRQDLETVDLLKDHEMFRQMFAVADEHRDALRAGTKRLAGIMSDADGDRLYLLMYDPATDTIVILSGDETAFIQATYLLQAAPPAWREAFKGAGFATTVESDFFAADAAATLGLTKAYTGVGDKWILLQAVTALLKASIGYLEQQGGNAIQERLARIKAEVETLGGASMRMAAAVRLMEQLDTLAAEAQVPLDEFLMTPGAIPSAVVTEESGHNVTALYITTKDGRRLPVFIGSGQKSAINTLVAMQALFPNQAAQRDTIYGKRVDLIGFAREPFLHGHKRTHYAFYVDKTRLVPGSAAWQGLSRTIRDGIPRVFGSEYSAEERPRPDEPDMLYFVVRHAGKDVGAAFVRPSGTENKASLYVRGLRDLEGQFNRLGAMVEVAANQVLGDTSSPSYQAREAIATRLRAAEGQPIALETLRRDMETHVRPNLGPQRFEAWWDLFWKEMTEKAKVFTAQDGQVTLVPRVLQSGDRNWVYNTAAAGMEEVVETAPAVSATVRDVVRDIRNFFATAPVPTEFQPGMGLVVDLATGFESDALAALLLPKGTVVVVTTDALLKAEQLAGRTAIEQGITTVTVDSQDGVSAALRVAVAKAREGVHKTVRVYSELDSEDLRRIVNDVSAGSVEFNSGLSVEQILRRLRPGDASVSAFLILSGRARQEWQALREYL